MKKIKIRKFGAIVITMFFLGTILTVPSFTATNEKNNNFEKSEESNNLDDLIFNKADYVPYDRNYVPPIDETIKAIHNDIGYNVDSGDQFNRANVIYVGEIIDRFPGRGRIGYLDPDSDVDDWYKFTVCEGQTITASIVTTEDYSYELVDYDENPIPNGYLTTESEWYYLHIFSNTGA